ncbi:MAG: hypothetical protein O6924_01550 [Alphaproteobacteria bacterium]|nr:hypothetical protein [Alphaproteobacteria bacterium]
MKDTFFPGKAPIVFLALVLMSAGGCASTAFQVRPNLAADPEKRRIVLLTPDVELSVLHAGGLPEVNAEWTQRAKKHIADNLARRFRNINAQLVKRVEKPEEVGSDPQEVQLLKLHGAVGRSILIHQYDGAPLQLPTKKDKFAWTMGPDTGYLKQKYGADYALFVFVRDSYTSSGRVAAIIFAALLGVHIQGGIQLGFSSLVDLDTGEVVWFNRLIRGTGDLRTPAGANETVGVLLSNFPQ